MRGCFHFLNRAADKEKNVTYWRKKPNYNHIIELCNLMEQYDNPVRSEWSEVGFLTGFFKRVATLAIFQAESE